MIQISATRTLELHGTASLCVLAAAYAMAAGRTTFILILTQLLVGLSVLLWLLVSFSVGKYILSILIKASRFLLKLPFRVIRGAPRLIRLVFFEGPVVITFYVWFRFLVFVDRHILRRILYWLGGSRHASGIKLSTVNSIAPSFAPIGQFTSGMRDDFDLKAALSMANISRLSYEDETVIDYELNEAKYDKDALRIITYHNTSGFITRKKGTVVIAFRGTEPLNLMHILTDLKGGLTSLASLDDADINAGRVHYGFLEALRLHRKDKPENEDNARKDKVTVHLDDEDTVGSVFSALFKIVGFLFHSTKSYALQPISLTLPKTTSKTAFEQIHTILKEYEAQSPISSILVTGHSLGGALATVFFAQSLISSMNATLVEKMQVYSFGAPRLGDDAFAHWMAKIGADKRIFKIIHAQDLIPRQPTLPQHLPLYLRHLPYADSPGVLVHLHPLSEHKGTIEEMPGLSIKEDGIVPSIELWGLTGLLAPDTIHLIRNEPWLWVLARIVIPFVMFDHLASEYSRVIGVIWSKSDEGHFENQIENGKAL